MRWRRPADDAPDAPAPADPDAAERGGLAEALEDAHDLDAVVAEADDDPVPMWEDVGGDDRTGAGVEVVVPPRLGDVAEADLVRARRRAVARALAEDLGDIGDVTTAATVPPLAAGAAQVVARAGGVVAGVDCIREVFDQVDPRVEVRLLRADGDRVARGDVVATVHGRLRSVLTGERVALNFVCLLSGVATQTRRYVDAVDGTGVAVRDTRKTTPGLRLLEKAAVEAGGGTLHRVGLYDALLVKDNHVVAAGGAGAAARLAMDRARGRHVQVEVTSLDQLDEVLRAGVTDLLLDNFTTDEVRDAVRHVAGRASLEASGNVTLDTVRGYAETGVDRIATGALTHSAPWLDLAMDVDPLYREGE